MRHVCCLQHVAQAPGKEAAPRPWVKCWGRGEDKERQRKRAQEMSISMIMKKVQVKWLRAWPRARLGTDQTNVAGASRAGARARGGALRLLTVLWKGVPCAF